MIRVSGHGRWITGLFHGCRHICASTSQIDEGLLCMRTGTHEFGALSPTSVGPTRSFRNRYESVKPVIDFALALVLVLFSAPVVILAVILVRLDSPGPSIYTHKRLGLKGKVFTIYRIRTIYHDPERNGDATWCIPGGPRITLVGRFLRWSHADELPQFINVLKGDMSLVGPRPERPEFLEQIERALPNYRRRLTVRPGLTGLAQLQQPPDTDLKSVYSKLNYDLCYLERISFWLDLRLIVGTILKCLGVPFVWIARIAELPELSIPAQRSRPTTE